MNITVDHIAIVSVLQLLNSAIFVPIIRYVVLLERRLVRLETIEETRKKD